MMCICTQAHICMHACPYLHARPYSHHVLRATIRRILCSILSVMIKSIFKDCKNLFASHKSLYKVLAGQIFGQKCQLKTKYIVQSNSVIITNSMGPSVSVRYNHEAIITVMIYVVKLTNGPKTSVIFVRYSRELVITVIVITEFDSFKLSGRVYNTTTHFNLPFYYYISTRGFALKKYIFPVLQLFSALQKSNLSQLERQKIRSIECLNPIDYDQTI